MIGFQTEVVGHEGRERWLEMYSGSSIAPGFFAWVIPSGFGTHRIGLWSTADRLNGRSIESCYQDLMDHPLWKERFENTSELPDTADPYRPGWSKNPVKDRVMLLETQGMAKPTTGGGLGPGFHQIQCILAPLVSAIRPNQLDEARPKAITKQPERHEKRTRPSPYFAKFVASDCTDEVLDKHFLNFGTSRHAQPHQRSWRHRKTRTTGHGAVKTSPSLRPLALKAGVRLLLS